MTEARRDHRGLDRCPWGCGRVVRRTFTAHGRLMYVDPDPVDSTEHRDGNVACYLNGVETWRSRALRKDEQPASFERRFMPHIVTCSSSRKPGPSPADLPAGVIHISAARARRQGGPSS